MLRGGPRGWVLLGAICGGLAWLFVACGESPSSSPDAPKAVRRSSYGPDGSRGAPAVAPPGAPNLVVLVVDTLRRDCVALPGEAPASMPHLERRAAKSVSFRHACAPAPWTVPSLASLFTGLLPSEHGVLEHLLGPRLAAATTTYAEALSRGYGYHTAMFSDAPWHRGGTAALFQGFETGSVLDLERSAREGSRGTGGFYLGGAAASIDLWDAARDKNKPFFLFLHTFDAHDPYGEEAHAFRTTAGREFADAHQAKIRAFDVLALETPAQRAFAYLTSSVARGAVIARGPAFANEIQSYLYSGWAADPDQEMAAALESAYRKGTTWVDRNLEAAIAHMEAKGLLENTLLVVTSDHGEAFGEHGTLGHGHHLYDELVRIPLVMKGPGPFANARVVEAPVGLHDVLPTFFEWVGLEPIEGVAGRSFLSQVVRGEGGREHVLAEAFVVPEIAGPGTRRTQVAVRSPEWKYLLDYDVMRGVLEERLYHLTNDPAEERDLGAQGALPCGPLPADFRREIEHVRDLMWADAGARDELAGTPYAAGAGRVAGSRPPPCVGDDEGRADEAEPPADDAERSRSGE